MKATKEMLDWFKQAGHPEDDMQQLKAAVRECKCTICDDDLKETRISKEKAVEILGLETFLSGISRAAFHRDCARYSEDGKTCVFFSLAQWWK